LNICFYKINFAEFFRKYKQVIIMGVAIGAITSYILPFDSQAAQAGAADTNADVRSKIIADQPVTSNDLFPHGNIATDNTGSNNVGHGNHGTNINGYTYGNDNGGTTTNAVVAGNGNHGTVANGIVAGNLNVGTSAHGNAFGSMNHGNLINGIAIGNGNHGTVANRVAIGNNQVITPAQGPPPQAAP
jgi:hypothetical protein